MPVLCFQAKNLPPPHPCKIINNVFNSNNNSYFMKLVANAFSEVTDKMHQQKSWLKDFLHHLDISQDLSTSKEATLQHF